MHSSVVDKNKSAYKLNNFGPIYYLNMDADENRKGYMEEQFNHWGVTNYERVSAYDGRDDDLSGIIKGRYPDMMSSGEVGCITSHLKAIKHWYDTSDSSYAIIMEDDCNLVQIAIIQTGDIHVKLHRRFVNDFSTACYMITRHHAEKLIRHHVKGPDKYRLDNGVKPRPVADDLIYNSGNTYSLPLLLYRLQLGSSIHPEHVDAFHKQNFDGIMNWWTQMGATMDVKALTDFDPYLGKVSDPTQQR